MSVPNPVAPPLQPPVIVIPGITAATLVDAYTLDRDSVWSLLEKEYERITLHPDDLRYEQIEPSRVEAESLFGMPYSDFIKDLRHDLTSRGDEPVPVFGFPYDWRKPLADIQRELGAFIEEVIARTSLLRHYYAAGYRQKPEVDLVGHSMGGLIIDGYLATTQDRRVRKVTTLGTPFRGSFEAVLKVATGTAALGTARSNTREREAARLMPALYHLVPSVGVTAPDPAWTDLFNAASWQPSVIDTIAERIRLNAVAPAPTEHQRRADATALLQSMLDEARAHRATVEALSLAASGMTADDWLSIVGVGEVTRVRLQIKADANGAPFFDLDSDDRLNGYPVPPPPPPSVAVTDTGDGTVPYFGARASFIPLDHLVCVCDGDFGYWELRDRAAEALAGLHGLLPAMDLVERLVVAHFKGPKNGKGAARDGIWGRMPPDLPPGTAWDPPIARLKAK